MRKDVKLAFAVGAILISVLVVYVLVVPGGEKRPDKQAVTMDTTDKAQSPAPAPAAQDKPTEPAKPAETAPEAKSVEAAPTTKPTDPFAAASDKDKEDSWMLA